MRGLVLEGGGVKGAFHAGAIKALYEHGIYFQGVMGTSIGALNGALIAQNSFDDCYSLWQHATPSFVVDINDDEVENFLSGKLSFSTIKYFFKVFAKTIENKGLSIDKLSELVEKYIDEEKLRQSDIIFGIVTVNLSDKWEALELFIEDIPYGEVREYIMASAYYPAFNRPEINGKSYIDGGMYDNLPINPLIRKGFKELIVIRTMSKMPNKKNIDENVQVNYILPSEKLGKSFDFTKKNINYLLKLGYFDALKYVHKYCGKKYYIKNANKTFEGKLLGDFEKFYIKSAINDKKMPKFAEYMIKIKEKNRISVLNNDLDAILFLLEKIAKKNKLEKFKVYTYKEFVNSVSKLINEDTDDIFEKYLIHQYKHEKSIEVVK